MQRDISQVNQQVSCLTDEQILKLSNIGVKIEKLYGNVRDIEWAIHEVCTIILVSIYFNKKNGGSLDSSAITIEIVGYHFLLIVNIYEKPRD